MNTDCSTRTSASLVEKRY